MRKKKTFLLIAVATALLFAVGSAYASTISVVGPTEVNPGDAQFDIDIFIDDIGSLGNLDFWQLGLQLVPLTNANATFVSAFGDTNPDYVFFGDSDDFADVLLPPDQMTVGDLTTSGAGVTDVVGKLLTSVTIDISQTNVCEWYSLLLFDSGNTFFGNAAFDIDFEIALAEAYNFHSVPIPGTLLLFGSGLAGLAALRRRRQIA